MQGNLVAFRWRMIARQAASASTTTTASAATTTITRSSDDATDLADDWIQSTEENEVSVSSLYENDDSLARSAFGTKAYWDDIYSGQGDFPAEEYSWYYGWHDIARHLRPYLRSNHKNHPSAANKDLHILVPGIGNDPILLDLLQAGFGTITAQDYSAGALERQRELLSSYAPMIITTKGTGNRKNNPAVELCQGDVRRLPREWHHRYDVILEKGLLDAVYLAGEGHVEMAVSSLAATVQPGGLLVSVSGVVPADVRRTLFADWTWLRDGTNDLAAGCFIFQKAAQA